MARSDYVKALLRSHHRGDKAGFQHAAKEFIDDERRSVAASRPASRRSPGSLACSSPRSSLAMGVSSCRGETVRNLEQIFNFLGYWRTSTPLCRRLSKCPYERDEGHIRTDRVAGVGQYVEARGWMVTAGGGFGPRTYRAYVPHLLSGWEPVLSESDHEAVAEAERALGAIGSLPLSDVGTAIARWMAARDESIRSSLIEGVGSTEAGLAWARYMDATGRPVSDQNDALTLGAAKQVASAVALGTEMRSGRECGLDDILDIHKTLFDGTRDRSLGGSLRDEPIWVGPPGCLVDDATFVAPPPERLPELMDDLVDYLNTSAHPPVLKAAVAHVQFETIHPFGDGNGRTGRAIIHTVLNAAGRAHGAVPISTTLSNDRRSYYAALNAMQSVECGPQDADARSTGLRPWLRLFSGACEEAAQQAARSARRVEAIAARWQTAGRFRAGSAAAALVAELPSMPVLDSGMVAQRLQVAPRTARRALASLEAAGIVDSTGGRRNRRYQATDLVGLLRQMAPDGGPPIHGWADQPHTGPAAGAFPPRQVQRCGHQGVRSKLQCRLPNGHAGHHRYRPPS